MRGCSIRSHWYVGTRDIETAYGEALVGYLAPKMEATGKKRRWSELSGIQRTAIVGLAVFELVLKGIAARDLKRRSPADVRGSKLLWAPLLLVNFFGPVAYLGFGRR